MLGLGQAEQVPVLAVLQELGRLQQHLDAGGRGLHGGRVGAPRAARSLAAGRPAPLTSPRRANKFRRESACFKFESAGGDGAGHAPHARATPLSLLKQLPHTPQSHAHKDRAPWRGVRAR